jgi:hypothetical protein
VARGEWVVATNVSRHSVLALILAGLFATGGCVPERAAGHSTASVNMSVCPSSNIAAELGDAQSRDSLRRDPSGRRVIRVTATCLT